MVPRIRPFELALLLQLAWLQSGCRTQSHVDPHNRVSSAVEPVSAECLSDTALSVRSHFVNAAAGGAHLAAVDEWAQQLSAFDRSARMRTVRTVGLQELLSFLAGTARDWSGEEERYWTTVLDRLGEALAGLNIGLPNLSMIKTSGEDEFGFAYSRGRAIVLPQGRLVLAGTDPQWDFFLLAHELFHLLSGENEDQLVALQVLLGVIPVRPVAIPPELDDRRISNPNPGVYTHDRALSVQTSEGRALVVPLLRTNIPLEEVITLPTSGPPAIFRHVEVVLIPVDTLTGEARRGENGDLRVYEAADTDWVTRMQRNSSYVIHPNELLADNFALLMQWRITGQVPESTPSGHPVTDVDLLRRIEEVLTAGC
jgi:hypothetical protein